MNEIKGSLPGQAPVERPAGRDHSVLRGWHGYSRQRADREINNWLYNHGPTHTGRA